MPDVFTNLASGTLSATASAAATVLNSAAFANLPTIAAPNTMRLTLDPSGVAGAPEIVVVTAHTAAATSITVTRQQETGLGGGAARIHNSGTVWLHGLTAFTMQQIPQHVTSTTRPPNPAVGDEIIETDTLRKLMWDGTSWFGLRVLKTVQTMVMPANVVLPNNAGASGATAFLINGIVVPSVKVGDVIIVSATWHLLAGLSSQGYIVAYAQLWQPSGNAVSPNVGGVVYTNQEYSQSAEWMFVASQAGVHSVTLEATTAYAAGTLSVVPNTFMIVKQFGFAL